MTKVEKVLSEFMEELHDLVDKYDIDTGTFAVAMHNADGTYFTISQAVSNPNLDARCTLEMLECVANDAAGSAKDAHDTIKEEERVRLEGLMN